MAAPGSFTAGSVLTAAEMNALNVGQLDTAVGGDTTVTTSDTDVTDVTFTLASSRRVMFAINIGRIDLVSTDLSLTFLIQDAAAGGTPGTKYHRATMAVMAGYVGHCHASFGIATFSAGTHTLYLVANTNTGTVRLNQVSSFGTQNRLAAFDVGEP